MNLKGKFGPSWESLKQYTVPEWYRDAKFGIFIHWGVYSVPAFANEWYSRNLKPMCAIRAITIFMVPQCLRHQTIATATRSRRAPSIWMIGMRARLNWWTGTSRSSSILIGGLTVQLPAQLSCEHGFAMRVRFHQAG